MLGNFKIVRPAAFLILLFVFCSGRSTACSPISPPQLLNLSIANGSLLLDWQSTNVWTCSGYSIEVEIACINSQFTGVAPFFYSAVLNKTTTPQAYPQQTISLYALCPGTIYQLRAREVIGLTDYSSWTSVLTFTAPGAPVSPALALSANPGGISCAGQTVQLSPSLSACGALSGSYSWLPAVSLDCDTCSNPVASPSVTTTYSLVTSGGKLGCWGSITNTVTVIVNSSLASGYVSASASVCAGQTVSVALSGNAFPQWQVAASAAGPWNNLPAVNGTAFSSSLSTSTCYQALLPYCAGSFTTNVVCVTAAPVPTLDIQSSAAIICQGQTANVTVSGADSYTWNTGANATVITIAPGSTTTYSVYGAYTNGCGSSANFTQPVSLCTGIFQQAAGQLVLDVYPNPSTGEFCISSAGEMVLDVTNQWGQQVVSITLSSANHYNSCVKNMSPGIYLITNHASNQLLFKKIIVAN